MSSLWARSCLGSGCAGFARATTGAGATLGAPKCVAPFARFLADSVVAVNHASTGLNIDLHDPDSPWVLPAVAAGCRGAWLRLRCRLGLRRFRQWSPGVRPLSLPFPRALIHTLRCPWYQYPREWAIFLRRYAVLCVLPRLSTASVPAVT